MARSKKQTTGPFPRRLTRAQQAAERRNTIDEPPSNNNVEEHPLDITTVEPQPVDAITAKATVEEASAGVENTTIVQLESPGPMAGHLSRSQILAARRHANVAAAANPKPTSDDPTPVTGERNLPINPPQPPPTVAGTSTTSLPSDLPPKTTLTHPYTMEFVDDSHIVITHNHSTTPSGTSTADNITTTPATPTRDPQNTNPNPKPGEIRDFDRNEMGETDIEEDALKNVQPLVDKKGKKPMVITSPTSTGHSQFCHSGEWPPP